jgi:uncharacterized protein YndB with AHSA1/START domain
METGTFTIEETYPATVAQVWKAITDKDQMKVWYFDLAEFKPEVGFEFRFWGGPAEDRQYLHICRITEVIPEKKLVHSWEYDGYTGSTLVSFELFEETQNRTRLKLTHQGLDTFPKENSDFAQSNFLEGWTFLIGTSLKNFLNK